MRWQQVTNRYMLSFAVPECRNCDGKGEIVDGETHTVCSCATLAFRRALPDMVRTGRVRARQQRIGKKMLSWLEYKPLVLVSGDTSNDDLAEALEAR
jgi:hypothetical protein